ncbi:hypothetical protein J6590_061888 [Homalodisca vitripennis]|nr:hypothetical protein J6590_061888 [Homalodisca vitripennis]
MPHIGNTESEEDEMEDIWRTPARRSAPRDIRLKFLFSPPAPSLPTQAPNSRFSNLRPQSHRQSSPDSQPVSYCSPIRHFLPGNKGITYCLRPAVHHGDMVTQIYVRPSIPLPIAVLHQDEGELEPTSFNIHIESTLPTIATGCPVRDDWDHKFKSHKSRGERDEGLYNKWATSVSPLLYLNRLVQVILYAGILYERVKIHTNRNHKVWNNPEYPDCYGPRGEWGVETYKHYFVSTATATRYPWRIGFGRLRNGSGSKDSSDSQTVAHIGEMEEIYKHYFVLTATATRYPWRIGFGRMRNGSSSKDSSDSQTVVHIGEMEEIYKHYFVLTATATRYPWRIGFGRMRNGSSSKDSSDSQTVVHIGEMEEIYKHYFVLTATATRYPWRIGFGRMRNGSDIKSSSDSKTVAAKTMWNQSVAGLLTHERMLKYQRLT